MKVEEIKNRDDAIDFVKAIGKGDRQINYGSPEDNFERIAALQKVYRELKVNKGSHDESDVAIEMILMKVARLMNNPKHMDSVVDIIGYALCLVDIITQTNSLSYPLQAQTESKIKGTIEDRTPALIEKYEEAFKKIDLHNVSDANHND